MQDDGRDGRDRCATSMRVLRSPEVCRRCGLSRVTIWRLERAGAFPKRRYLTKQTVGWLEHEVDEWIAARSPLRPD